MVSKEEVINAFRFILGREPEDESVVARYAAEVVDMRALRIIFINSAECPEKQASLARPALLPMLGAPLDVDVSVSPMQLAALFAKIRSQWQHLGETEPHWSVLTSDSYFQKHLHMHRDAFYASGRSELMQFEQTLLRAGAQPSRNVCLELGCGVGRVTAQLAGSYNEVVGVDISTAHLEVARQYMRDSNIENVRFEHLDEPASIEKLPTFDLLYSRMVLQHNPPPLTAWLLDRLLARMNPGGIAYFQIPTYRIGYRFNVGEYLATPNATQMEMHFLPQPELFRILTRRAFQLLEIREDDAIGLSASALSNTVLARKAKTAKAS